MAKRLFESSLTAGPEEFGPWRGVVNNLLLIHLFDCQGDMLRDTARSKVFPGIKRIYIAGPMTGIENYNRPKFNEAAAQWRETLHIEHVINPAENFDGRLDLSYETYIRKSIEQVLGSSHLYMLDGWKNSRGARLEHDMAMCLGLTVWYQRQSDAINYQGPIEEEARSIVGGERHQSYGSASTSMKHVARTWEALLSAHNQQDVEVSGSLVCRMMAAMKLVRQCNSKKRDNLVDAVGYTLLDHEVND
jgi:hypothetical protein